MLSFLSLSINSMKKMGATKYAKKTNKPKQTKKKNNNRGPPCEINAATFMLEICFLVLASFEESVESWGICHSSVSVEVATLVPFPNAVPLL